MVGKTVDGHLLILGGNQSNTVSIARYNPSVFEFRCPGVSPHLYLYKLPALDANGIAVAGSEA